MVGSFHVIVVASEQDIAIQSAHSHWQKMKGVIA
jgi:hypothetical protein